MSIARLVADGLLSDAAAVDVADLRDERGARRIAVRIADGWSFDVLPDRGLDIGAAWWRGSPVAWRSPIEVDPGPARGWGERFLGGLVVTCGPDAIGVAGDGSLHGSHSATPAHAVTWRRARVAGSTVGAEITGAVDDVRMFGRHVRVERTISASDGDARLTVRDRIVNRGLEPAPVAFLYHVNLGAPAIVPGTRVEIDAERTLARERTDSVPDATVLPAPIDGTEETVFEHRGIRSAHGVARAIVRTPTGRRTEISWSAEALPRCYQWVLPTRGGWALGIEPANAPLFGPERDDAGTRAVLLAPGESVETAVSIAHEEGTP